MPSPLLRLLLVPVLASRWWATPLPSELPQLEGRVWQWRSREWPRYQHRRHWLHGLRDAFLRIQLGLFVFFLSVFEVFSPGEQKNHCLVRPVTEASGRSPSSTDFFEIRAFLVAAALMDRRKEPICPRLMTGWRRRRLPRRPPQPR